VLINNPSYSGVIMQSYKTGRKVTVNAEAGVNKHSGGGFGGIWVRNDTSGDIRISSAATVRSTNDDGITGATNGGNVSVSNSGQVTSNRPVACTPTAATAILKPIRCWFRFSMTPGAR
jgi:hypothetical protein